MPHHSCMVFGVYDQIGDNQQYLLKKAAERCEKILVAVSSDEEVVALFKKPSEVPLGKRAENVKKYCEEQKLPAEIIAVPGASPEDIVSKNPVDAFILSESQHKRFGKELSDILNKKGLPGAIETV